VLLGADFPVSKSANSLSVISPWVNSASYVNRCQAEFVEMVAVIHKFVTSWCDLQVKVLYSLKVI
jgi:hypothetical protein